MTLDEAIKHAEDVAKPTGRLASELNASCSMEHLRLAGWLRQLRTIETIINDGTMTDETKIGHIRNVLNGEY